MRTMGLVRGLGFYQHLIFLAKKQIILIAIVNMKVLHCVGVESNSGLNSKHYWPCFGWGEKLLRLVRDGRCRCVSPVGFKDGIFLSSSFHPDDQTY